MAPYYALASGFLTGKYRNGTGDSPRAERARQYLDERGRRVLDALDEVAAAHDVKPAAVAIAWLAAKPGVAAPIASATSPEQLAQVLPGTTLRLDRRGGRASRRGVELMDATRQAFLDELYAHGRAHDEALTDRLERFRNVEPETAELLGVLVRAMGAERVLEIGTSNGYSTIWLGDAAEAVGGSVLSLEIEAERTAQALDNLTQAGVHEFVELRTQDAAEALAAFADGAFDLVFLDAERREYAELLARPRARAAPARPAGRRQHALARQGPGRVLRARLLRRDRHQHARHRRLRRAAGRQVAAGRYCCGLTPRRRLNAVLSANGLP